MQEKLSGVNKFWLELNKYEVGRWLCFNAGVLLALNGLYKFLIIKYVYYTHTNNDFLNSVSTFASEVRYMKDLHSSYSELFFTLSSIGWINMFGTGVGICAFSFIGLKEKNDWTWNMIFLFFLWTNFNNFILSNSSGEIDFLNFLKILLLAIGLSLTRFYPNHNIAKDSTIAS